VAKKTVRTACVQNGRKVPNWQHGMLPVYGSHFARKREIPNGGELLAGKKGERRGVSKALPGQKKNKNETEMPKRKEKRKVSRMGGHGV